MALDGEDEPTARMVKRLAQLRLRDRFAVLRARHPLPPPSGDLADKDFFDALSGEA